MTAAVPIVTVRAQRGGLVFTDQVRDEFDGGRGFTVGAHPDGRVEIAGQGWFVLTRGQAQQLLRYLTERLAA